MHIEQPGPDSFLGLTDTPIIYTGEANKDINVKTTEDGLEFTADGISIGDVIAGGISGSILFIDSSLQLAQDNANLFWDDSNNRLGIGTSSPERPLHIIGETRIQADGDNSADRDMLNFLSSGGALRGEIVIGSNATFGEDLLLRSNTGIRFIVDANDASPDEDIIFAGGSGPTEYMRIISSGNVGFGTDTPDQLVQLVKSDNSNPVYLKISNTDGTASAEAGILLTTASNENANNIGAEILADRTNVGGAGSSDLLFKTSLGSTMNTGIILKANGFVGIGTSTPVASLHLSSIGDNEIILEADTDNTGEDDNPTFILRQDGNSVNGLFGINGTPNARYTGALGNATYIEAKRGGGEANLQLVTGATTIGGTDGVARMTILKDGKVGFGTNNPFSMLSVIGGTDAGRGIFLASVETDATTKVGSIKTGHYTNAEKPITIFAIAAAATTNTLFVGGGTGSENAVTEIRFLTAANNITPAGTERMNILSSGRIGINEINPDAMLEIVTNATTEEGLKVKGSANQSASLFLLTDSSDNIYITSGDGLTGSEFRGNDQGVDIDFVWEGNTLDDLFIIDAGLDAVKTGGGRIINVDRITGNTTLNSTHHNVFVDTDGGDITITLPAGVAGTYYRIVNTGTSGNQITITPNGAENLLGENSNFILNDQESLIIIFETTEHWN